MPGGRRAHPFYVNDAVRELPSRIPTCRATLEALEDGATPATLAAKEDDHDRPLSPERHGVGVPARRGVRRAPRRAAPGAGRRAPRASTSRRAARAAPSLDELTNGGERAGARARRGARRGARPRRVHRPLPGPLADRPRRHGRGLRRLRSGAGSARRPQAPAHRAELRGRPEAPRARGAGARQALPPQRGAGLRRRRARGRRVRGHGAGRGAGASTPGAGRARRRAWQAVLAAYLDAARGLVGGAREGARPSRRQAVQHPARQGRPRARRRLRPRAPTGRERRTAATGRGEPARERADAHGPAPAEPRTAPAASG